MTYAEENWDKIYASGFHNVSVAGVLAQNVHLLGSHGLALDIACGKGANAFFLARLGLRVHAWDISSVAINHVAEKAARLEADIEARSLDIKGDLLPDNSYDLILNCHYLDRQLTPAIKSALKPGGKIVFQTFTMEKRAKVGPTNPEFLLKKDELLRMFSGFEIQLYKDESQNLNPDDPLCGRACIIAKKPKQP